MLGQPVALKFDLKGSEFGRKASQHELSKGAEASLKDLDFDRVFPAKFGGLRIRPADYEKLAHRINEDARVRPHSLQPALSAAVALKHALMCLRIAPAGTGTARDYRPLLAARVL